MNAYTPEMIEPENPDRIVPIEEGVARLRAIRAALGRLTGGE